MRRLGAIARHGRCGRHASWPSARGCRLRPLAYVALVGWTFLCLGPLYWLVVASLVQPVDAAAGPRYLPFLDFQPTLHGWRLLVEVFHDEVARPYLTTLELSAVVTAATMAIALPAAYALCRWRLLLRVTTLVAAALAALALALPGIGLASWPVAALVVAIAGLVAVASRRRGPILGTAPVMVGLLVPRLLPPIAVAVPLYQMLRGAGLLASWAGTAIADVAVGLPVAVWLLRGCMIELPRELDEAARIEGAGPWRVLWSIVVPMIRPGLAATALLIFVLCWNEYLFGVYLTSGGAGTLAAYLAGQVAVREQMASAEPQGAFFAALILVSVLPPLACAVIFQRWSASAAATLLERRDPSAAGRR
jgi:multiple sugar transport system permease protein